MANQGSAIVIVGLVILFGAFVVSMQMASPVKPVASKESIAPVVTEYPTEVTTVTTVSNITDPR